MRDNRSVCFAYYLNDKFVGWYADTFGSVRRNSPKIYSYSDKQLDIIKKNFSNKIKTINGTPFEEAKENAKSLIEAIMLLKYDGEQILKGEEVELRVVECPFYDGPNPNFDPEAYKTKVKEAKEGEHVKCDNWIYADYTKVKEWANDEPTQFLETIKPE